MKLRVFIQAYGIVLLLAISVAFKIIGEESAFRLMTGIVFLAAIAFGMLLADKKYILSFFVMDKNITVNYLNHFLQSRQVQIDFSEITDVRLSKRTWFAFIWSPVLQIRTSGERYEFYVLKKELYEHIQKEF